MEFSASSSKANEWTRQCLDQHLKAINDHILNFSKSKNASQAEASNFERIAESVKNTFETLLFAGESIKEIDQETDLLEHKLMAERINLILEGSKRLSQEAERTQEVISQILEIYKNGDIDNLQLGKEDNKQVIRSRLKHHLKPPISYFTGRKEVLDRLKQECIPASSWNSASPVVTRCLCGDSGAGKTETAIKFANDNLSSFCFVWEINAEKESTIQTVYRNLAEMLHIYIFPEDNFQVICRKVNQKLSNHEYEKPFLLIFDNCETIPEMPTRGGVVLLTSTTNLLHSEETVQVKENHSDSTTLIQRITQENNLQTMETLATLLEDNMLLVDTAASLIRSLPSYTVEDCIGELKNNSFKPLSVNENARYGKTIQRAFSNIFEKVFKENPLALEWMQICAYLNPEEIDYTLLTNWLRDEKKITEPQQRAEATNRIAILLKKHSLLRETSSNHLTFSLHRLRQEVFRETESVENKRNIIISAIKLLLAHFPKKEVFGNSSFTKEFHVVKGIIPHCVYLVAAIDKDTVVGIESPLFADLLWSMGKYHYLWNELNIAEKFYIRAYEMRVKLLGQNHIDVGFSLNDLGALYFKIDYKKGQKYFEDSIKVWQTVTSNQQSLCLGYGNNNLGTCFFYNKDFAKGIEFYEKAIQNWESCPENFAKNLLVIPVLNSGVAKVNIRLFCQGKEALEKAEKLLNELYPNQPHQLKILLNSSFADLLEYADFQVFPSIANADEKEKRLLEAYRLQKELYQGRPMPDRVSVERMLGKVYSSKKMHDSAVLYCQNALDMAIQLSGENHKDLIAPLLDLTFVLSNAERYKEAKQKADRALELAKQYLERDDPNMKNAEKNVKYLTESTCIIC